MKSGKRRRLEAAGWRVGTAQEFLGLSDAEAAFIDIKLRLASALAKRRADSAFTQFEAASILGSSQSRVAKMEAGDESVTADLLIRSLLTLGASPRDVGKALYRMTRRHARSVAQRGVPASRAASRRGQRPTGRAG